MTYSSIANIVESASLRRRIVAAAAAEGISNPDLWVSQNIWKIASHEGWASAWDYAVDNYSPDYNPDTGCRPGVISDAMILEAVQQINI